MVRDPGPGRHQPRHLLPLETQAQRGGVQRLEAQVQAASRLRGKVHWTPEVLILQEALRKQNPTWGRWPIWLALRKEGVTISERTVGRILAYLEAHGRVESVAAFLARARPRKPKRKQRRPYA